MSSADITDLSIDDSDDEGEVPPLLPPSCASAPTVPSKPSTQPKPKPEAAAVAAAKPAVAAAPPAPKPGANLKVNNGLKKGFLSGGGGSSRPNKASASSSKGGSEIPMVRADVDAKTKSLQLPEVQSKIEAEQAEAEKVRAQKGSASWMTPELLQKIAAKPILRKAFTDPKCQAAMSEMQTNPQEAMKKYGDVPEMREFLQAFMKLMGEHFTALADKQEAEKKAAEPVLTPEQKKAQEVANNAMADPEVRAIVAEPKIQALLANMQAGKAFELEAEARRDPDIVRKLRKLSEAGLIGMHFEK